MKRGLWAMLLGMALLLMQGCVYHGSPYGYRAYPSYGVYYGWNYGYRPQLWTPHYRPYWGGGWRGRGWGGGYGWGGPRWHGHGWGGRRW